MALGKPAIALAALLAGGSIGAVAVDASRRTAITAKEVCDAERTSLGDQLRTAVADRNSADGRAEGYRIAYTEARSALARAQTETEGAQASAEQAQQSTELIAKIIAGVNTSTAAPTVKAICDGVAEVRVEQALEEAAARTAELAGIDFKTKQDAIKDGEIDEDGDPTEGREFVQIGDEDYRYNFATKTSTATEGEDRSGETTPTEGAATEGGRTSESGETTPTEGAATEGEKTSESGEATPAEGAATVKPDKSPIKAEKTDKPAKKKKKKKRS